MQPRIKPFHLPISLPRLIQPFLSPSLLMGSHSIRAVEWGSAAAQTLVQSRVYASNDDGESLVKRSYRSSLYNFYNKIIVINSAAASEPSLGCTFLLPVLLARCRESWMGCVCWWARSSRPHKLRCLQSWLTIKSGKMGGSFKRHHYTDNRYGRSVTVDDDVAMRNGARSDRYGRPSSGKSNRVLAFCFERVKNRNSDGRARSGESVSLVFEKVAFGCYIFWYEMLFRLQ